MRVLKGQSDTEVSSRGLAAFVGGLILATFLGGALRTYLHSEKVHHRVLKELRAALPRQTIELGQSRIVLSEGFWPSITLVLNDLSLRQEVCGKLGFDVVLPDVRMRLGMLSALRGRLNIGQVLIESGHVQLDYRACRPDPENPSIPQMAKTSEQALTRLDGEKIERIVSRATIKNVSVTYVPDPHWRLAMKSIDVYFAERSELKAEIEIENSRPAGKISHSGALDLQVSPNDIEFRFNTNVKEGRISARGKMEIGSRQSELLVTFAQLPVRELVNELKFLGWSEWESELRPAWLSGRGAWTGSLDSLKQGSLVFEDLKLDGGYGRATLAAAQLGLVSGGLQLQKPVQVLLSQISLQTLLEVLPKVQLPKSIGRLGTLSGTLDLTQSWDWKLAAVLESLDLIFSQQSVRGQQTVGRVNVQAQKQGDRVEFDLVPAQLTEGVFEGQLKGDYSLSQRRGHSILVIRRLAFSPQVQTLLVNGRIGELSGEVKAEWQDSSLVEAGGRLRATEVSGAGWAVKDIQVDGAYKGKTILLKAQAAAGEVGTGWRYGTEFAELGDRPGRFHALSLQLELEKTSGRIREATARQEDDEAPWNLTGGWGDAAGFSGVLRIPAQRSRAAGVYRLTGDGWDIKVSPPTRSHAKGL